jgi:RNA polymerase sigma factor (sigma-70 family)
MAALESVALLTRAPEAIPPERFAALYRECVGDVYAYVAALVGERAAAEDVTALAFERAYRARHRFDARRGGPRAWVFGIARNAALDELRRRRRARLGVEIAPAPAGAEHSESDTVVRRETVRAALATLSAREREIVLLKFHGQLSARELAQVLGVSETSAGTRLHRAMSKLRAACGEEMSA